MLAIGYALVRRHLTVTGAGDGPIDRTGRDTWRMPPLTALTRPVMSTGRKIGMGVLRLYPVVAMTLVIIKIVQMALGH